MKSNRFTAIALLALAALTAWSADARAQCTITGPDSWCGSPVTLCGPDGSEFYVWTFEDGSMQYGQCITVNSTGTYSLRFIDPATGSFTDPCTKVLTSSGPAPAITGDTTGCEGTALQLCGPAGNFEYEWGGPSGFAAATACISAATAGDYTLRIRSLPDGCWTDMATQAVAFSNCAPPPPPPSDVMSCPRPAWWWSQNCPDHDSGSPRLSAADMASVGDCVNAHGGTLDGGLCRTLLAHPRTLDVRARREIATVMANICAGELGITSLDGRPVSLNPNAAVDVAGYTGTVSDWVTTASATLVHATSTHDRKAMLDACREVIRVAWHINRGIGIGPVCPPPTDGLVAGKNVATMSSTTSTPIENDPEPLAAELVDDTDASASLAFGLVLPNPFTTQMSMGYAITSPAGSDVTIGIYDISGRLVRELVNGFQAPGQYAVRWDGRDAGGAPVRGGIYFVLGRVDGARVQTRVTLVR